MKEVEVKQVFAPQQLVRGDSCVLKVWLSRVPTNTEILLFTAKDDITKNDHQAVVQKTTGLGLTHGESRWALVELVPQDTEGLNKATKLWCDIQAVETNGARTTLAMFTVVVQLDVSQEADPSVPIHTTQPGTQQNVTKDPAESWATSYQVGYTWGISDTSAMETLLPVESVLSTRQRWETAEGLEVFWETDRWIMRHSFRDFLFENLTDSNEVPTGGWIQVSTYGTVNFVLAGLSVLETDAIKLAKSSTQLFVISANGKFKTINFN